jgi:hypothetical protein
VGVTAGKPPCRSGGSGGTQISPIGMSMPHQNQSPAKRADRRGCARLPSEYPSLSVVFERPGRHAGATLAASPPAVGRSPTYLIADADPVVRRDQGWPPRVSGPDCVNRRVRSCVRPMDMASENSASAGCSADMDAGYHSVRSGQSTDSADCRQDWMRKTEGIRVIGSGQQEHMSACPVLLGARAQRRGENPGHMLISLGLARRAAASAWVNRTWSSHTGYRQLQA